MVSEMNADLDIGLHWHNRFAQLGPDFSTALPPQPLPAPYWVGRSAAVARELGLDAAWMASDELLNALTGNRQLAGTQPLASVYSGHQFGVWAGQLGDGRALMLGETAGGLEVQLKGAGRTPYSRGGDGRAVLRSSIREFLCSEAMHGLGVPTSRALCVTGSDAPIYREEAETAAVVTRVAPSFIRFGHFEHFAYRNQLTQLQQLADYVIDRYYPACRTSAQFSGNPYAALLQAVSERTAEMVAHWQAVGFCHGVMNTDNMSVLGLTLDYGPFQYLDGFDADHICNHSDTQGRYAYARQPQIAYWNLFCLGQALMPLIEAQAPALAALESYKVSFPAAMDQRMRDKLGLSGAHEGDRPLVEDLLQAMQQDRVDYTVFWRRLSVAVRESAHMTHAFEPVRDLFLHREVFDVWCARYLDRLGTVNRQVMGDAMLRTNPKYILRNHLGEMAIRQAKQGNFAMVQDLLQVLHTPFDEHTNYEAWAGLAPEWASSIEISCSS